MRILDRYVAGEFMRLFILFVMAAIAVGRAARDQSIVRPVLAITAAVIFAFFVYSATKRRVEANWPASIAG